MSTIDVLRLLARELGATPIDPTRYCPICWTPTVPTRRGDTVHATPPSAGAAHSENSRRPHDQEEWRPRHLPRRSPRRLGLLPGRPRAANAARMSTSGGACLTSRPNGTKTTTGSPTATTPRYLAASGSGRHDVRTGTLRAESTVLAASGGIRYCKKTRRPAAPTP
jgi:hypothetical protein